MGVNDTGGLNQAYAVANQIYKQLTGKDALATIKTGDFVTVGTMLNKLGKDKVLGAITELTGKTVFGERPYEGVYKDLWVDDAEWGAMTRQIDFGDLGMEKDLGYGASDGQSVDMYKRRTPKVVQTNFYGYNTSQYHLTTDDKGKYATAFRSAAEFNDFVANMLVKVNNERTITKEGFEQGALNNYIASIVDAKKTNQHVHLLSEYKKFVGDETLTPITVMQASNYFEFIQWAIGRFDEISTALSRPTVNYHFNIPGDISVPKHTPKEYQMCYISQALGSFAKTRVVSNTHNPSFLEVANVNYVDCWQSSRDGADKYKINVTPSYFEESTGNIKTAAAPVTVDNIMGFMFDRRAIGLSIKDHDVYTTPVNAAGRYYNTYWHWEDQYVNNFIENAVLFTLD